MKLHPRDRVGTLPLRADLAARFMVPIVAVWAAQPDDGPADGPGPFTLEDGAEWAVRAADALIARLADEPDPT